MKRVIITAGQNSQVHFLEKWLPGDQFIFGIHTPINSIPTGNQVLVPSPDHPNFVHALLNVCLDHQIKSVYPLSRSEQDLLAEALTLFDEFGIRLIFPDMIARQLIQQPYEMLNQLIMDDISTVPFFVAETFNEFSKGCLQLGYPSSAVSFTNAARPGPVWLINEGKGFNDLNVYPITFSQAAHMLNRENQEPTLLRKISENRQSHWVNFETGSLKGSWLMLDEAESRLINNLGAALNLSGIYLVQLQDKSRVYNLSTLLYD